MFNCSGIHVQSDDVHINVAVAVTVAVAPIVLLR